MFFKILFTMSIFLLFFFLVPFSYMALLPNPKLQKLRIVSLVVSLIIFLLSLILWISLDKISINFQWVLHCDWNSFLNIYFSGGLDGISLLFIVLTAFLIPLCILYSWRQFPYFFKELLLILFSVEFLLFHFFLYQIYFFFLVF